MDLFEIASKPELIEIFAKAGRDLLDPYSEEYNSINFKERFNNLIKIYSAGVRISTLVMSYRKFWSGKGREDISAASLEALCDILEYFIEDKLQDRYKRRDSSKLRYAERKAEKERKKKADKRKAKRMLRVVE